MAGFCLLTLIVAMSVLFAARERATSIYARAALQTENRLADTLSTVREAESSVRGYILTHSPVSLNTYDQALAALPRELHQLDAVLANGANAQQLGTLHRLVQDKLTQLAQAKALEDSGQSAAAAGLINTDLNLGTMGALRTLTTQMQAEQEQHITTAEAAAMHAGVWLQIATAAAALATILLAWFAIRASRAQTRELRTAEAALLSANAALEYKVAERTATLHASERRFRSLSETIPGIVYMTDPAGKTVYVNPQCCDYAGLPAAEMLEFGWTQNVHPDDLPGCLSLWNGCVASGQDYEMEYRLRRHDGLYRWFLDRAVALKTTAGAISAWIGTSTDIDDRKMAEAALENANSWLEQRVAERSAELDRIFRLSTDILAVGGMDGEFFAISPAWERILGHSATSSLGRSYGDFLHPEDGAAGAEVFTTLRSGQPAAVENRFRRADGSHSWLAWRAVAQLDQNRIYWVARDITQEREREAQLRQSQKMEVIGRLTGGVAHDFNNLLTIILGSLELLQRGLRNAEPKLFQRVEAASEAARRAAALTHRLLAFSRSQPLEPKALDLNRLLAGMSDMLHRTLGETIAVELVNAAGLWPAMADANQLENAILNLAVNARDAMPDGGHLSIETQNTYLDESYAAANMDITTGQYVMIAVTDTGSGMSPEVQAKVFEPFFTTKAPGEGTGLGLAQVYGYIKQSGGHVSIYSEPGEGTTVKLYLPRLRGQAGSFEAAATPELPPRQGHGETILIVEDEPGVRNFSAEVLRELGYHVLTAENAADALRIFAATPGIRVLFTDVVLTGGMNGRQLADEILRGGRDVIVLFTTGYTRNAIIHHGRLDEGINFIGKPFTATALGTKIGNLLEAAKLAQD